MSLLTLKSSFFVCWFLGQDSFGSLFRSRSINLLFEVGWLTSIDTDQDLLPVPFSAFDWWSPIVGDLRFLVLSSPIVMAPSWSLLQGVDLCASCPFYHSGDSFLALFVCLLLGGFLPQYRWTVSCTILVQFIPYGFGEFLFPCCWEVLCTICMLFIPLLLGESFFQYHWNVLYTVHMPFIPYCLGNSLVQYCWIVLCAICMLFALIAWEFLVLTLLVGWILAPMFRRLDPIACLSGWHGLLYSSLEDPVPCTLPLF